MTPEEAVGKEVWIGLGTKQWKVDNYRLFFVNIIKDKFIYLEPSIRTVCMEDRGVIYRIPLKDVKYIMEVEAGQTMDELHGLYWDIYDADEIGEEQGEEATESSAR